LWVPLAIAGDFGQLALCRGSGGGGYAAALYFPITTSGDYYLVASSAMSAADRATSGDYTLLIGINTPEVLDNNVHVTVDGNVRVIVDGDVQEIVDDDEQSTGATIAVRDRQALDIRASVSETSGILSADSPVARLKLVDIQPGDTLYAFVEATDGSRRPSKPQRPWRWYMQ